MPQPYVIFNNQKVPILKQELAENPLVTFTPLPLKGEVGEMAVEMVAESISNMPIDPTTAYLMSVSSRLRETIKKVKDGVEPDHYPTELKFGGATVRSSVWTRYRRDG